MRCLIGVVLIAVFGLGTPDACTVPVYRYSLEKWESDLYRITLFYRDSLSNDQAARAAELAAGSRKMYGAVPGEISIKEREKKANMSIRFADVADSLGLGTRALWKAQKGAKLPWVVIRFPRTGRLIHPMWAGALEDLDPATLMDSPARSQVAEYILDGESAVWVFLKTGNAKKDKKSLAVLRKELRACEKDLKLPEIDLQDKKELLSDESKPPLRISFKVVEVDRNDRGEMPFVSMLIKSEPKMMQRLKDPMVFPVFGRGRALYGLAGDNIGKETVMEACSFLAGPCACIIKQENPGVDMLFSTRWDDEITETYAKQEPMPPLRGLGGFMGEQGDKSTPNSGAGEK